MKNTVCINLANHNASLCILKNNEIVLFIQEERLSRNKNSSELNYKFISIIKKYLNKIDNLILVNFNNTDFVINEIYKLNIFVDKIIIDNDNHHLFHAASSFYSSGFEEAICLVIDGWGSSYKINNHEFFETTSIFKASYPDIFYPIYKNVNYDASRNFIVNENINNNINISHRLDIGVMYGTVSNHLGFGRLEGGKTMGLSSYGYASQEIPNMLCDDTIHCNMNLFKNDRTLDTKLYSKLLNNDFKTKANIAYSVQKALEKVFIKNIDFILTKTNNKNIVFSGGCALNILGNSLIKETYPDINFYVDPIANDASQSLGAAKYYYHKIYKDRKINKLKNIFLGPEYSLTEIKKSINDFIKRN